MEEYVGNKTANVTKKMGLIMLLVLKFLLIDLCSFISFVDEYECCELVDRKKRMKHGDEVYGYIYYIEGIVSDFSLDWVLERVD